jgi:Icc-related predicted phosphoesterase
MKLLAFSDLHLARARAADLVVASAEADLVVGAGDFCNARQGLAEAMELLSDITAPMVMVAGNAESADELRAAAPASAQVLHGNGVTLEGVTFWGLGGGVPETPFGAWSWDLSEEDAEALLEPCERADVLVTHSPPKGLGDLTSTGLSVGSTAIRAAIERLQPKLSLFGHVHEAWGARGQIGRTDCANLGPMANFFEVSND